MRSPRKQPAAMSMQSRWAPSSYRCATRRMASSQSIASAALCARVCMEVGCGWVQGPRVRVSRRFRGQRPHFRCCIRNIGIILRTDNCWANRHIQQKVSSAGSRDSVGSRTDIGSIVWVYLIECECFKQSPLVKNAGRKMFNPLIHNHLRPQAEGLSSTGPSYSLLCARRVA